MIIVYTDTHLSHQPQYEVYDGRLVAYAETSQRAETIIAAIRSRKVGAIIPPRRFPLRHLYAVHQKQYVDFIRLRSAALNAGNELHPSYFMSDTYAPIVAGTYDASRRAADAALTGAELLLRGTRHVYSLCRPPGHHAAHHTMGGYCYFNNAAIAAEYLSRTGRIAILDIDFHHGNGVQDAFYDRSEVLYVSLHADPVISYPYSSGYTIEQGAHEGFGYTTNYPLSRQTNNKQYLRVLSKALARISDFSPDYLVVCTGFDTFYLDPIGGFQLTADVYPVIGNRIASLNLPTLLIQEGGYNVTHLGNLVADFLSGFNNKNG